MRRIVLCLLFLTAVLVWPMPFILSSSTVSPFASASEDPIPTELHAGTEADPWVFFNSATIRISWENAYGETQIVRADFSILDSSNVVVKEGSIQGSELFPKAQERHEIGIYEEISALPNGVYRCRARVWDENGNVSDWSEAIYARKQWQELAPPGGCVILR